MGYITNYPDGLSSFGMPLLPAGLPVTTNSKHYFVDPVNGNDNNDGLSPDSAFASLTAGEDATTANQHDVVFYTGSSSGTASLTEQFVWDKNYTHLIGLGAPTGIASRNRIFQDSSTTDLSPLMLISASGCIFSNFYIFQGVADTGSLINVQVTGGRNYFWRVHFAGGGHATQAINGGMSLKLGGTSNGTCEENVFEECTIGVDTIDAATGMVALAFDGEAHRNEFRRCRFRMRAGNSGAAFVEVLDSTGIDRDTIFEECYFINNSTGTDMASAFLVSALGGEPRLLLLRDCIFINTTKLDASDSGVLFGNMPVLTAGDTSGLAKELIS